MAYPSNKAGACRWSAGYAVRDAFAACLAAQLECGEFMQAVGHGTTWMSGAGRCRLQVHGSLPFLVQWMCIRSSYWSSRWH
jgi:hypothetical protein